MPARWVLFDLNGTVLDTASIAEPLGGDVELVEEAFQEAVMLAMADSLSAAPYRPLPDFLRATLERRLRASGGALSALDDAMDRAAAMHPFPESEHALRTLRNGKLTTGVLTNSETEVAEKALDRAGLGDLIDVVIGADVARVFKPHPSVYHTAIERLGADPAETWLVAPHSWDVSGATRAGLRAVWVSRREQWLVPTALDPEIRATDLLAWPGAG